MYPKLGAIPTSTGQGGEEGEVGEVDGELSNEYANEGQEHRKICKHCSMRTVAVSIMFTVAVVIGGGFLYHHLSSVTAPPSGYPVTEDSLVPQSVNEWKAFDFVFKRNERTEALFSIIDRYESVSAALQGGNDGDFRRITGGGAELTVEDPHYASIKIDAQKRIVILSIHGLKDDDILDLSCLPRNLKKLTFDDGTLTTIDFKRLPRGLQTLTLRDNRISKMVVEFVPPSLKLLRLARNPLEKEGVTLKWPLPNDMELTVGNIDFVNLNGGEKTEGDRNWIVTGEDGCKIKVSVPYGVMGRVPGQLLYGT